MIFFENSFVNPKFINLNTLWPLFFEGDKPKYCWRCPKSRCRCIVSRSDHRKSTQLDELSRFSLFICPGSTSRHPSSCVTWSVTGALQERYRKCLRSVGRSVEVWPWIQSNLQPSVAIICRFCQNWNRSYLEIDASSGVNSFAIGFLRLSAFQNAIFY